MVPQRKGNSVEAGDLYIQLEPDYPAIRDLRNSRHITKVMQGCIKMNTKAISRKSALTLDDVRLVCDRFKSSTSHDDLLFVALLTTGFHGLLWLGELTLLDNSSIRDWRKVTRCHSLLQRPHEFEFLLPAHKADRFFEGNWVLIRAFSSSFDPVPVFSRYLFSRDHLFPAATPLWLTFKGEVPSRSFFLSRFHLYFPKNFGGASLRSGGATHLAQLQTPDHVIRAIGRWSSDAWELYIRVHPTLLHALLHRC